jgi:hypothetical protein
MQERNAAERRQSTTAIFLELRRRQVLGLVLLAIGILGFSIGRAGFAQVFFSGWWRIW